MKCWQRATKKKKKQPPENVCDTKSAIMERLEEGLKEGHLGKGQHNAAVNVIRTRPPGDALTKRQQTRRPAQANERLSVFFKRPVFALARPSPERESPLERD